MPHPGLINGTDSGIPQTEESLKSLGYGAELVGMGPIRRSPIGERVVHYIVPHSIAGDHDERAAYCPEFNEEISDGAIFWPHIRARWDAERE